MKIPGKIRFIVLISSIILLQNCTKAAEGSNAAPPAPELPVYTVIFFSSHHISGISNRIGREK
ncbi:hypothetical protein QF044_002942 [Chryseobacterium sp. W4I1]|nr:hypothetical protein [Chryseobacterium sp. W4I1]MDQ0783088.1 hypothetical protein [Chryseobacterium sp. W4I1]